MLYFEFRNVFKKREHMSRRPKKGERWKLNTFTNLHSFLTASSGLVMAPASESAPIQWWNPSNYYLFVNFFTKLKISSGNCCILMSKLTFNLFWHPVRSNEPRTKWNAFQIPNNGWSQANARQNISNNNDKRNESIKCLIQRTLFHSMKAKY